MIKFAIALSIVVALASLALFFFAMNGAPPPPVQTHPVVFPNRPVQTAIASWYGLPFVGRLTASGEVFDRWENVAASRWLPFGTKLLLINPRNHKRVVVRIVDRGPFVYSRQLDLSEGAAYELGFHDRGITRLIVAKVE